MLNWSHKPQSGLALFHTSTSANCDQTAEFLFHFLPILLYPISASLNLIQSPKTLKQSPGVDAGGICLITSMIKNPTGQHKILWLKIRGKTGERGGEVIFAQCNRRSDPVLAVFLIIKKTLGLIKSLFFSVVCGNSLRSETKTEPGRRLCRMKVLSARYLKK